MWRVGPVEFLLKAALLRSVLWFCCALFAAGAPAETRTPVAVSTVRSLVLTDDVALHGSLVAVRRSRLSAEVDGLVTRVVVDDGDHVEANAAVVELDRRIAQIAKAESQALLDAARATADESRRRYLELSELRGKRHVSETEVAAAAAQAEIDNAQVAAAEARLARAAETIRQHTVLAPFEAVVESKLVEVGEWVETNTPLLDLVAVNTLRLDVPVPQYYFSEVKRDTRVEIEFDAIPDRRIEARVTRVIPVGDVASRTFRARIDLDNGDGLLAPGMSARVLLKLGPEADVPATALPRDAVVRKPDGTTAVWLVTTSDGVTTVTPRPVSLGRSYRDYVELLDADIAPGEQVVVRGNEILRPGQAITIAEEVPAGF